MQAAVPALIKLLEENSPETRREAMYGLMGIGSAAGPAVPALIAMLSSNDFHTQYWSCRALAKIGMPAAEPAIPILISMLTDGVASVRGNAAAALGQLGSQAGRRIVQPLVDASGR